MPLLYQFILIILIHFSFPGYVMSTCFCCFLCCWQLYHLDLLSNVSNNFLKLIKYVTFCVRQVTLIICKVVISSTCKEKHMLFSFLTEYKTESRGLHLCKHQQKQQFSILSLLSVRTIESCLSDALTKILCYMHLMMFYTFQLQTCTVHACFLTS